MKNYLDRYLAGEAPLHPERLELPTEEELDEKFRERNLFREMPPAEFKRL